MFKKVWQISGLVIFVAWLAVVQFSLVSAWPEPFRQLNLGVLVVTFSLFFFNFRSAIFLAFVFGLGLDLLNFNFIGFYLIPLIILVISDSWLANNWLTNRSLYSFLVLILLNTILYNLIIASFFFFSTFNNSIFFLVNTNFWLAVMYQALGGVLAAVLLFNLVAFLTKKIKPFFLEKKVIL